MAEYKINKGIDFTVKGDLGEYIIPRASALSLDDVAAFSAVKTADTLQEKLAICRSFLLTHAPDLEQEGLGDMGYIQIFNAYADAQGASLGKF